MLPFSEAMFMVSWYLSVQLIGLLTLPVCFFCFRNLRDRGYTISKILGFVLFSSITFFLVRYVGLKYGVITVYISLLILGIVSFFLLKSMKDKIRMDRRSWKFIVNSEAVFLGLFIFLTFLRIFNPDSDGGEAVMDFAFVNAIERSESFPPHYPWYSGENLERVYYYFGHFLTSNLIKLSGVSNSVGYNLGMITYFSTFGLACFGMVYNLTKRERFGLIAIILILFLGNMYGMLHIFNTVFPEVNIQTPSYEPEKEGGFFSRLTSMGDTDLFWWSTRVIPWTITEVPYFSFLWGDLHAHYVSYQFIVMFLMMSLNYFLSKDLGKWERIGSGLILALSLGFMFPQFVWNYPIYLVFTGLFLFTGEFLRMKKFNFSPILKTGGFLLGIFIFSVVMFLPSFTSMLKPKAGGGIGMEIFKTSAYHFLIILFFQWFLIGSFILDKLSSLVSERNKVLLKVDLILYLMLVIILMISFFQKPERFFTGNLGIRFNLNYLIFDFQMLCILVPVIVGSAVLIISKRLELKDMFILLLVITGGVVFLGAEILSIHGRYVFFFKLFPTIWITWGIASVYSLFHFRRKLNFKNLYNSLFFSIILISFVFSFFPYFTISTFNMTNKFRYSFGRQYPSIDSLSFVKVVHWDDYKGIEWINGNVGGRPIVLEYVGNEYSYASRVSSFTGLPTLVGWRFHSGQLTGENVPEREEGVREIYETLNVNKASQMLKEYGVKYIFIGELERKNYRKEGLEKFWKHPEYYRLVFEKGNVQIYEVNW